ncbi:ubiquitin-like domain-containing protein [Paraoerskovia marina]|uniref:aggregation-promoting factor C-terminal-like domain-containing protein n=1 Tax=Paraoerskovia marina TaxID=545619 RepID=UPI00200B0C95|nr:ubiquitin-like domain-containing protein [Paraoerskovia marina]
MRDASAASSAPVSRGFLSMSRRHPQNAAVRLGARSLVIVGMLAVSATFASMHKAVTIDYDGRIETVGAYGHTVDELLASQGVDAGPDDLVQPGLDAVPSTGSLIVVRSAHDVEVEIDGEAKTVRTTAKTVGEFLATLGERGNGAVTSGSRSDPIGRDLLRVTTMKDVHISVDGAMQAITTSAESVGDVLAEAGITLAPLDETSVPQGAAAVDGMIVVVSRGDSDADTVTEVVPFDVTEVEDPSLPEGHRVVVQQGYVGEAVTSYAVKILDGQEVSRAVVAQRITQEAREEIVHVGTMTIADVVVDPGSARAVAKAKVADRGWGSDQFQCLDKLWQKESGWRVDAANPSSSAYGIPQALPGSKMASAGDDWRTNAATQIEWGLGYISGRYGTPCDAWAHSVSVGWY